MPYFHMIVVMESRPGGHSLNLNQRTYFRANLLIYLLSYLGQKRFSFILIITEIFFILETNSVAFSPLANYTD
jgi:hypothetical protein